MLLRFMLFIHHCGYTYAKPYEKKSHSSYRTPCEISHFCFGGCFQNRALRNREYYLPRGVKPALMARQTYYYHAY